MNCTKAIIPVAGFGTRRLPITKAVEKCMLPICNRPIVDYVVEDCVKAGITDIYFVVSEESEQIRQYYGHNNEFETYLRDKGKTEILQSILPRTDVRFHFVTQDALNKYGTAIPVWLCHNFIKKDEHFLVFMGDDFIFNADGSSEAARLIAAVDGADAAFMTAEVSPETISQYGVVKYHEDAGVKLFEAIVEHPTAEEAPSNQINISKYIFKGDIFDFLEPDKQINPRPNGEYYIIDAINAYKDSGKRITVMKAQGQYLDGGTVGGWVEANNVVYGATKA